MTAAATGARDRAFYLGLFGGITALQAVLYALDPETQFYFGDSGSYLLTATDGFIPLDRSFVYGDLLRLLFFVHRGLPAIVIVQCLIFAATALMAAVILRRHFDASRLLAGGAALAMSLFPLHVIWTRYVLTEISALFSLTAFLLCAFEYLRSGHRGWIVLFSAAGICAVALRTVMIPPILSLSLLLPPLGAWLHRKTEKGGATAESLDPSPRYRKLLLDSGCVLLLLLVLHVGYQHWYAYRLSTRHPTHEVQQPAYSYVAGTFLLVYLSPLVQPSDLPDSIDGEQLLGSLGARLHGTRRDYHAWNANGLINRLEDAVGTSRDGGASLQKAAASTAMSILRRDPLGVVRLGWSTAASYRDTEWMTRMMTIDLGTDRDPPERFVESVREHFREDITGRTKRLTLLKRAYLRLDGYVAWLPLAFLAIPFSLAVHRRETVVLLAFLALPLLYFDLASITLVTRSNSRYLLSVSWVFMLFAFASTSIDWLRIRARLISSRGTPADAARPPDRTSS